MKDLKFKSIIVLVIASVFLFVNVSYAGNKIYEMSIPKDYYYNTNIYLNEKGKQLLKTNQDYNDKIGIIYDFKNNEPLYLYRDTIDYTKSYDEYLKVYNKKNALYEKNNAEDDYVSYEEYLYHTSRSEYYEYCCVRNMESKRQFYDLDGKEIANFDKIKEINDSIIRFDDKLYVYNLNEMKRMITDDTDLRLNVSTSSYIIKKWDNYFMSNNKKLYIYDLNYKLINIQDNECDPFLSSFFRLKCKNRTYYLLKNKLDINYYNYYYDMFDDKFSKTNLVGFENDFLELDGEDGDYRYGVSSKNKESDDVGFNTTNDTIYLKNNIYEIETENNILMYDFSKSKIINSNAIQDYAINELEVIKKFSDSKSKNVEIKNEIKLLDGYLYIIKAEKGEFVIDENLKQLSDYYDSISFVNSLRIKPTYSTKGEVIFYGFEKGKRSEYFTINKKLQCEDGYSPDYIWHGYYVTYCFNKNEKKYSNKIYSLYNDKVIDYYIIGDKFCTIELYGKVYFYDFFEKYSDVNNKYIAIFDEDLNFVPLANGYGSYLRKIILATGEDINGSNWTKSGNTVSDYIFAANDNNTYVIGKNFEIVKTLKGYYTKVHVYYENENRIFLFSKNRYTSNDSDLFDANFNPIVSGKYELKVDLNTNNILSKKKAKYRFNVSYKASKKSKKNITRSYYFDEKMKQYIEDVDYSIYDYAIELSKKKLYYKGFEDKTKYFKHRCNIYDEKGKGVFLNVIYTALDDGYFAICDDKTTKVFNKNMKLVYKFDGIVRLYISDNFTDEYYNYMYDIEGNKEYYYDFRSYYDDGRVNYNASGKINNKFNKVIYDKKLDIKIYENLLEEYPDYIIYKNGFYYVFVDNDGNELFKLSKFVVGDE